MSFQQARRDIAATLETLTKADGWTVTLEAAADLYHQLIVVGHAALIEADTLGSFQAELPVDLWVSEADDLDAADLLYNLISPPNSLLERLPVSGPLANRIQVPRARAVGPRQEGPSGFLAATIDIVLFVNLTGTEDW